VKSAPPRPPQECSEPGCDRLAAYRTRTRPTWCDQHITAILRQGGLEPLEPFTTPKAWRLNRCRRCGAEAHYRFEYTLEKNQSDEPTCRACHWREWSQHVRAAQGPYAAIAPVPLAEARSYAEEHGYEYLESLTSPSLRNDPHRVQCRYCGRISAERLGDIGFGCSCQVNPGRARQTPNVSGPKRKKFLKDSGLPVLDWWDHDANAPAEWETVTESARREAHWRCPHCGTCFTARVLDMVGWRECPHCEPKRRAAEHVELERFAYIPVAAIPELLAAWADEADPTTVPVAGGYQLRRFRCPRGHHPRMTPLSFLRSGCPSCRGQKTLGERLASVEIDPSTHCMNPEIASQWHPTKNQKVRLTTVSPGSRRTFWWREPACGHEWQATPADRDKGQRLRCPVCRTILDSLAYHYPELAAQWSPENPVSEWQIRPTSQTRFIPTWVCTQKPGHVWQAPLASRAAGAGCPECREHGKSRVELAHHAAAELAFGRASSGQSLRHKNFRRRTMWLVDITTELPNGRRLAIEYDGAFWHADKTELDTEKSLDLLAAGYLVARLREHPLGPLSVRDGRYSEFIVHSTAPDPEATIELVKKWATTAP